MLSGLVSPGDVSCLLSLALSEARMWFRVSSISSNFKSEEALGSDVSVEVSSINTCRSGFPSQL